MQGKVPEEDFKEFHREENSQKQGHFEKRAISVSRVRQSCVGRSSHLAETNTVYLNLILEVKKYLRER